MVGRSTSYPERQGSRRQPYAESSVAFSFLSTNTVFADEGLGNRAEETAPRCSGAASSDRQRGRKLGLKAYGKTGLLGLRVRQGLSMKALAKKVKLSITTVWRFEHGLVPKKSKAARTLFKLMVQLARKVDAGR